MEWKYLLYLNIWINRNKDESMYMCMNVNWEIMETTWPKCKCSALLEYLISKELRNDTPQLSQKGGLLWVHIQNEVWTFFLSFFQYHVMFDLDKSKAYSIRLKKTLVKFLLVEKLWRFAHYRSGIQGVVSQTLCEHSKIISWKYTMPEITLMARISSWNFVCVPKAWLCAYIQNFSLKLS